jgi:hypothetical protein
MQFWSKGLGKKTIQLTLSKGESIRSGDKLFLQGQMEAPVSWEYIMPMGGDDLVDFFELLKEPAVARYIHSSPNRWQLYGAMIVQGLLLAGMVLSQALRHAFGRTEAELDVKIEVPPASVRKKKAKATKRKPYRRRLGTKTTEAPSLSQAMKQQSRVEPESDEETESVDEAIQAAMKAAADLD